MFLILVLVNDHNITLNSAIKGVYAFMLLRVFFSSHLIGAGNAQSVEDWHEGLRAYCHHQSIRKADEDEDGSVLIHFYRGPQNGDC